MVFHSFCLSYTLWHTQTCITIHHPYLLRNCMLGNKIDERLNKTDSKSSCGICMYILLSQKHLNNVIRGDSFRSEQTAHTSPSRLQSLLLQWNISTSLVYLTVPFCYYKDIFLYWTGLIKDATEYFCISKLLCSIFLYEQWIKVTERGSLHCSVYSLTLPCYMEPVQNPIWYHGGNSVATD